MNNPALAAVNVLTNESIVTEYAARRTAYPRGTSRPHSHSHVAQGNLPLSFTGQSLVGWRLYAVGLCAEITTYEDGQYYLSFVPQRGRTSIAMGLMELLRYKARFIHISHASVFELKSVYAA